MADAADGYKVPKSLIFKRGRVGQTVKDLVDDMRQVMSPNTAPNLRVQEKNTLKDFVNVSSQLGVTQFFIFSATDIGTYMRLVRIPHGPTLTFRISSYSLMSDIHKLQARPKSVSNDDRNHAPILILNNFSSEENHIKIMASAFQNAFPALNVHVMKLKDARRVVLLHYDKEEQTIEFRHYLITTTQLGLQKSVKRLLQRKITDMGDEQDIADYILSQTGATESDAEDMANMDGQVDLPDTMGSKVAMKKKKKKFVPPKNRLSANGAEENDSDGDEEKEGSENGDDDGAASVSAASALGEVKMVKSAVRLSEIGPRMQMKLIKVEEGLNDGIVLFHALKTKSEKELEALERKRAKRAALKAQRKKEQDARVEAKIKAKGRAKKDGNEGDAESSGDDASARDSESEELHEGYRYEHAPEEVIQKPDDVEWYRKEVGEEPTEEEKRELIASQPVVGNKGKYNPHWQQKNSKKRSGDQVSGGRGGAESKEKRHSSSSSKPQRPGKPSSESRSRSNSREDGKPARKKFKTVQGSKRR